MGASIKLDGSRLRRLRSRMRLRQKRFEKEYRLALADLGARFKIRMRRERFTSYRYGGHLFQLSIRSGKLRGSIRFRVQGRGLGSSLRLISQGVRYARFQEFGPKGGVHRSRKGKLLKIPLPPALTPKGRLRADAIFKPTASRNKRTGAFKRRFVNSRGEESFVFTSKRGNKLIAKRKGDDIVPLFVLKESVKIRPRLGFHKMWFDLMRKEREDRFQTALRRSFGGAL